MRKYFSVILCLFICPCFAKYPESVVATIQKIARTSDCRVGVAAIHIESDRKIYYQANTPFFMASTVKLPIAITLLNLVDARQEQLERPVKFNQQDSVPGSGILFDELSRHPWTHTMTIAQLLKLMMIISDNTATDLLLKQLQGPSIVYNKMQSLGFKHIVISRNIYELYLSASGISHCTLDLHSRTKLRRFIANIHPERKVRAWKKLEADKQDTTTASDMALLLAKLYQGKLLTPHNTSLLLCIMRNCQTGQNRIKGLLPRETKVAHKTGTWTICHDDLIDHSRAMQLYQFANDVGIITLPRQKGHIAIAIYVKSKAAENKNREKVIAKISREIYDYFLYH